MRKNVIILLAVLITLSLFGCGTKEEDAPSVTGGGQQESPLGTTTPGGESAAQFSDATDSGGESAIQSPDTVGASSGESSRIVLKGSLGSVNCVDGGSLLLAYSRIMLMDSCTLEIQKGAEYDGPLLINPKAGIYGDNYVLLGEFEGGRFQLVECDSDLHVGQVTDIQDEAASEREIMNCKLFPDGNKLLYNNINGLYLFDLVSGETTDLTQDGIFIFDFAYLEEQGEILFIGSNASGERVLGAVGMDGEKRQEESAARLWGEIWAFGDHALIEEAELVGQKKEGVVLRYDAGEGIRSFPLTDSDENGNITVSCHGAYYATRTSIQTDEVRYLIRIYSSEDGSMIKELPLSYEEYGENFRLSGYLICDDVNRIILYGTWRGQETDAWIVSITV